MVAITTLAALREAVDYYLQHDEFCFDTETLSQTSNIDHRGNPRLNRVVWLSLATHGRADVIPLGHPNGKFVRLEFPLTPTGEARVAAGKAPLASSYSKDEKKAKRIFTPPPKQLLFDAEVKEILRPLFFSDRRKIGHNIKFDLESIAKHFGGEMPPGPYADTLVAAFILDVRNKGFLSLDDCLLREIEYKMTKGVGANVALHGFHDVAKYAWLDAKYTWLLWQIYKQQIDDIGMDGLWRLEMDVLEAVAHMEQAGAPVDVEVLKVLDKDFRAQLEDFEAEIYRLAGRAFNINSGQELQRVLYLPKAEGGRGLKPKVLTPGGKKKQADGAELTIKDYATSEDALKALAGKDPIADALMKYSDMKKLISGFIVPYLGGEVIKTVNGKSKTEVRESLLVNGRIHARFDQCGAETGRFSSKEPNLQQVPSRSAEGKAIRSAFVAPPGFKLIVADYSQIEPRLLTDLSNDPKLLRVYLEDGDIYTTLADPFGLERSAGKVLFLSVAYGTGPETLASATGMTFKDAKKTIYEDFPKAFPSIEALKKATISQAKRRRPAHVRTLLGRRRYLPELFSHNDSLRRRAERQAFNTLIQGGAADLNKVGLVRVFRSIPEKAQTILTVHDEVVVLTLEEYAEETLVAVREAMEGAGTLMKKVPLVADAKICQNWSEGK